MSQIPGTRAPRQDESLELDDLVDRLVVFHGGRDRGGVAAGSAQQAVLALAEGQIAAIRQRLEGEQDRQRLAYLHRWLEQEVARLAPIIAARGDRVRASWALEHPHSLLRHEGRVLLVNAIGHDLDGPGAKSPVDPACDLASLLMGLESRGEEALARYALDRYLQRSCDYEISRLLSLFRVFHALRGARRALQRRPEDGADAEHPALLAESMAECRRFLHLAEAHAEFRFPPLVIGVGVSGSGKSRFTRELVERLGAVRLSSTVERRRAPGVDPGDLFSPEATLLTYQRLASLAGTLLDAGLTACVDATSLKRWQRDLLREQAEARGLPCLLVSFEADDATLRRRIEKRARHQGTTPDESLTVLARQQDQLEPLADEERLSLVHLDTTADDAAETLAGLIREHIRLF